MNGNELNPGSIMELGTAFWASRTFIAAVELGVFTELAQGPLALEALQTRVGLHARSSRDFLDALVSLKMLEREGGTYRNTPETNLFLDKAKPTYIGGLLDMFSRRLYAHWAGLTDSLRTGVAQQTGGFEALYETPAKLREFLGAMTGVSIPTTRVLAQKFPWKDHKTFFDIGGAQGACSVQVALAHPHLTGGNFDLPEVGPVYEEYVKSFKLESRLKFRAGNFFKDELPTADVLVMGHVLHDWGLADKKKLLAKAYKALPAGGVLLVYEGLIDDDRRKNTFGLLMSLNMLIETKEGFDYTGADCIGWMKEAGFRQVRVEPLAGPHTMVVATK